MNSLDPGALVSLFWTILTVSEVYGVLTISRCSGEDN